MNMREIRRLGSWQEWLTDTIHLLVLCLCVFIALIAAWAFQPRDDARTASHPETKICGAEGGVCQW